MAGQIVAAQMLLSDDQQVDAELAGVLADGPAASMSVVDLSVHAEAVEDNGAVSSTMARPAHELSQIGLAQLVNEIELAVRRKSAPPMPENVTRLARVRSPGRRSGTVRVSVPRPFSSGRTFRIIPPDERCSGWPAPARNDWRGV